MLNYILCVMTLITPLQALIAENTDIEETIALKGHIESHHTEYLQLPFSARLTLLQPYGSIVSKHQPIYKIEYLSQDDSLSHQIYNYLQEEQVLHLESQHMDSQKALIDIGAISQKSFLESLFHYDKKSRSLLEKKQSLNTVLAPYHITIEDIQGLNTAEKIEDFIERRIPNVLHAPINGILLPISKETTGSLHKKETNFAKIVDHTALEINLSVTEEQLNQLIEGQSASITIPSIKQSFKGSVFNITPYPEGTTSRPRYSVTIRFSEEENQNTDTIRLGMQAIINVSIVKKQGVLVPISAIKHTDGKDFVVITNNNKYSSSREVSLGQTYGMNIEILSGLKPGEEILEHH